MEMEWREALATTDEEAEILQNVAIPSFLTCPLSLDLMMDPVQTADGQVYDRVCIEEWFDRGQRRSPKTNLVLPSLALQPVRILKRAVEDFLEAQPDVVRKALEARSMESIAESLQRTLKRQEQYTLMLEDNYTRMSARQQKAWRRLLYSAVLQGHAYVLRELAEAASLPALHIVQTDAHLVQCAVRAQNPEVLKELLAMGAPINSTNPSTGSTLAHAAAFAGHGKALETLSHFGMSMNIADEVVGKTPLHISIDQGHVQATEALIRLGADLEIINGLGYWPVNTCWHAPVQIAEVMILHRASPNSTAYFNGHTALHDAAISNRMDRVETLLRLGARSDIVDFFGCTPADHAATMGNYDVLQKLATHAMVQDGDMYWVVLADGGVVVRERCSIDSAQLSLRLAQGSIVRQTEALRGHRLRFQKIHGVGPSNGWASVRTKASGPLLYRTSAADRYATLVHHCQQLLHFTSPDRYLPKMTSTMLAWMERLRTIASDTLTWLESHRCVEDVVVRHWGLLAVVRAYVAAYAEPIVSNQILNPLATAAA